jgi:biotin carboxyl carrier protein
VADEIELLVDGTPTIAPEEWTLTWVDRDHGVALLRRGSEHEQVAVEGGPTDWTVTVRGRRVPVTARSHRDRLLADAGQAATHRAGPADLRATLPGLVVRIHVTTGDAVTAGDPLVTIEAMKMQNEIRAPRAGVVSAVEVTQGQTIAGGALLVRLAEPDP